MKQGKMKLHAGVLTYTTHQGKVRYYFGVQTGRQGELDWTKENAGPIPPGKYIAYTKELAGGINLKWLKWNYWDGEDWGIFRVGLYPLPETDVKTREGFMLHGGFRDGSAGGIDVRENQWLLYVDIKMSGDEEIIVEVTSTPNLGTEYQGLPIA